MAKHRNIKLKGADECFQQSLYLICSRTSVNACECMGGCGAGGEEGGRVITSEQVRGGEKMDTTLASKQSAAYDYDGISHTNHISCTISKWKYMHSRQMHIKLFVPRRAVQSSDLPSSSTFLARVCKRLQPSCMFLFILECDIEYRDGGDCSCCSCCSLVEGEDGLAEGKDDSAVADISCQ